MIQGKTLIFTSHPQLVQRNNSDTGCDTQRTKQLCNYSNLPSSFKLAGGDYSRGDTDTIKSPHVVFAHDVRTWLLANMAAWKDNKQQDFFTKQE